MKLPAPGPLSQDGVVLYNYGGQYQIRIENARDIEKALELSNACWMATSAPCDVFDCDAAFLKFVDTDVNGRIRTDELRAAIKWMLGLLQDRSGIDEASEILKFDSLNQDHPDGKRLHASAKRVLKNLGHGKEKEVSLAQIRDMQKVRAGSDVNGDGIVSPRAAADPELAAFMQDLTATLGGPVDASGQAGVSEAELARFRKEAEAHLAWVAKGEIPEGAEQTDVLPWGGDSAKVQACIEAVRGKVEEFFAQCRLAALDERAAQRVRMTDQELAELDAYSADAIAERGRKAPLAVPNAEGVLDLAGALNPYHADALAGFRAEAMARVLGAEATRLTDPEWQQILSRAQPYAAYLAGKPVTPLEKLGVDKLKQYLASSHEAAVRELIQRDLSVAAEMAAITDVEKLILYQKWMIRFANNTISLSNLFNPERPALFQAGRLIMNGMDFTFNVKVTNRAEHKAGAQNAGVHVMYVEVTGKEATEKFEVATAVTFGEARGLYVGRRGIFVTPNGRLWDAKVVDVITHPVSLWEAIKAPFGRLEQMIEKQLDKYSGSRYAGLESTLDKEVTSIDKNLQVQAAPAPASPAAPDADRSRASRDLMVGVSVAVAALGSSFAFITRTIAQVKWWHLVAVLAGMLAVLCIPLILLAIMKLTRRNLSPLLEASGWAINGRIKVSPAMGFLFTNPAAFPQDARRHRKDFVKRYAQFVGRRSKIVRYGLAALIAIVCFFIGKQFSVWIYQNLHGLFESVLG